MVILLFILGEAWRISLNIANHVLHAGQGMGSALKAALPTEWSKATADYWQWFYTKYAATTAHTEGSERLLQLLLACYIVSTIHRVFLFRTPAKLQHVYFILCTSALLAWAYGYYSLHLAYTLGTVISTMKLWPASRTSIFYILMTAMPHLVYCCLVYGSPFHYSVNVTAPLAVLTLRVIGMSIEIFDSNRQRNLNRYPTTLEMLGYAMYTPAVFIGPQFPMKRYMSFTEGLFDGHIYFSNPSSFKQSLKRLLSGIAVLVAYILLNSFLPTSFLTSEEFKSDAYPLLQRMVYVTLWGQIMLLKYMGPFLIAEAGCTMTGLSYNGREDGRDKWNGCMNVGVWRCLFGTSSREYIEGLNCNTNRWMHKYIYSRWILPGTKALPHVVTLAFLALWHGPYPGYFVAFGTQFLFVRMERDCSSMAQYFSRAKRWLTAGPMLIVTTLAKKLWLSFVIGYAMIAFTLLDHDAYSEVYQSLYWSVHVITGTWLILSFQVKPFARLWIASQR